MKTTVCKHINHNERYFLHYLHINNCFRFVDRRCLLKLLIIAVETRLEKSNRRGSHEAM